MPEKPTTQFTPPAQHVQGAQPEPVVHPSVATSPEAVAYALGAQARLKQKVPIQKYTAERPGNPPPMPPLEAAAHEGMSMAQQAAMYGAPPEQVAAQAASGDSIVDGPQQFSLGSMDPSTPNRPPTPAQLGIMTTDMLPEEATQDPAFRRGQGAMFAVNQPDMALKYGVVRNGMHIPAQAMQANAGVHPGAGGGKRSMKDTIRDLQEASRAQAPPPNGLPKNDAEAEQQVEESAAGSSQNAGKPVSKKLTDSEKRDVDEAIKKMDDFDYDAFRRQMNEDNLNNPEQKRIIEERLEPLDVVELIIKDRVSQRVPVIPDKFEIKFTSLTGEDDLALKKLLMKESSSVEVTERYLLDKFAVMTLTAGLMAINNNPVPYDMHDKEGNFDDDQFWLKFGWVLKRGIHVLASIGANHTWFEMRVRKLLVAERVKNG
jgi:hypothetical protein